MRYSDLEGRRDRLSPLPDMHVRKFQGASAPKAQWVARVTAVVLLMFTASPAALTMACVGRRPGSAVLEQYGGRASRRRAGRLAGVARLAADLSTVACHWRVR